MREKGGEHGKAWWGVPIFNNFKGFSEMAEGVQHPKP